MYLITTSEQLASLIPNTTVTVTGETPLLTKLTPFLESSELWLSDTFLSAAILADIATRPDTDTLRTLTEQALAYDAFHRAIPHLDIILTPNGFGIVSNSNVAPASKERIERLMSSLLFNRDRLLMQLMHLLPSLPGWTESEQGRFFSATMFPNMDITLHFNLTTESRWEKYLALRQDAISIEHFLATQYISRELLEVLRWEVQTSQYRTPSHKTLCRVLRSIELRCLQSPTPMQTIHKEHGALFSLVNTIIESPTDFPEWHNSTTAQLYSPPVFENKKSSNGFWF